MPKIRFVLQHHKAIQGIHYLAWRQPGITQYYVGKVFFFADREHLLDWGRPISGDRYVAMQHGPVPSSILNLLKSDGDTPDEFMQELSSRVSMESENNLLHLKSTVEYPSFPALSGTDKHYLDAALATYGKMSFAELKELSHQDPAYQEAWAKGGLNNEMEPALWLGELDEPDDALEHLLGSSAVDHAASQV